mmetsp:Transcript_45066/g.112132  ORF Transcript_45066/g.112132 Transcript_45066/m.112132 type:complete len:204 (-) Transcript_45066:976-1587(-)
MLEASAALNLAWASGVVPQLPVFCARCHDSNSASTSFLSSRMRRTWTVPENSWCNLSRGRTCACRILNPHALVGHAFQNRDMNSGMCSCCSDLFENPRYARIFSAVNEFEKLSHLHVILGCRFRRPTNVVDAERCLEKMMKRTLPAALWSISWLSSARSLAVLVLYRIRLQGCTIRTSGTGIVRPLVALVSGMTLRLYGEIRG